MSFSSSVSLLNLVLDERLSVRERFKILWSVKRFKLKKKKGLGNFVHSHIFQSIYKIRKTPYVGDSVDALRRYLRVFVGICLLFIDTKLD